VAKFFECRDRCFAIANELGEHRNNIAVFRELEEFVQRWSELRRHLLSCGVSVYTFACSSPLPSRGRGQGEGRRLSFRRFAKPLTSRLRNATAWQAILSRFSKGRGDPHAPRFLAEVMLYKRALAVWQALVRVSLPKGESRVRVCDFSAGRVSEPVSSRLRNATAWQAILSPCTKGRGGQKREDFISVLIPEAICDALSKFWVRERGIARGCSYHLV